MCILCTRTYDWFHLVHSYFIPFYLMVCSVSVIGIIERRCLLKLKEYKEESLRYYSYFLTITIYMIALLFITIILYYIFLCCALFHTSLDAHHPELSAFPGNCVPSWSNVCSRYQVRTFLLDWSQEYNDVWGWYPLFVLFVQSQACPKLLFDCIWLLTFSFHPSTTAANKGRWQERQTEGWVSFYILLWCNTEKMERGH